VLDGEVIADNDEGRPDYSVLQSDLARGRGGRLIYYVFDLLNLDGRDIRKAPLRERRRSLRELLAQGASPHIRFSEHLEGDGTAIVANACAMGLEGIVSKDADAPYRSGRAESWIKVKCGRSDSFPIIAFVEKLGAEPRRVASLYIGRREDGRLLYAGKARSGYSLDSAQYLRELLDPYIRSTQPIDGKIDKPKATWVEPVIDAEIAFSSRTPNGLLREAVYKGVRDDLAPPPTRRVSKRAEAKPHIGVLSANILQLLPDAVVPSKEELAADWKNVGRRALAHLGGRPLTGDEPMTGAQASYLKTLCEETSEPFDESLTKAAASEKIDELKERSPRLHQRRE
jgi:bifunctional non-homologous end joining protein LigD